MNLVACRSLRRAPTAMRAGRWRKASPRATRVALLLPNCPDYLAIWLGITRIGGLAALINTNLTGEALAHCLRVAQPKHIIAGERSGGRLCSGRAGLAP